jgi:hypothetical protein
LVLSISHHGMMKKIPWMNLQTLRKKQRMTKIKTRCIKRKEKMKDS